MSIYEKTFKFLKRKYPDVGQDYETRIIEDIVYYNNYDYAIPEQHEVLEYYFLSNIPFDIRYQGGECVYIDGYILSDFRKVKKYINKIIRRKYE